MKSQTQSKPIPLVFSVEIPHGRDDGQVMLCWKGDMGVDDFTVVPASVAKELMRQLSPSAADRDIETVAKVSNARLDKINDLIALKDTLVHELEDLVGLLKRNRIRYPNGRIMPEVEQDIYVEAARNAIAHAK